MHRISKIVFCKLIETLHQLLYTAFATFFSTAAGEYPQHQDAGLTSVFRKSKDSPR